MLQIKMKKSTVQSAVDEARQYYNVYDPFELKRLSLLSNMLEYIADEDFVFIDEELFNFLRF